jgi:LysM repeat protein
MRNPFTDSTLSIVEQERQRRERFRIGVYGFQLATGLLLVGLLIQGCRAHKPENEVGAEVPVESATNPAVASAVAESQLETRAAVPVWKKLEPLATLSASTLAECDVVKPSIGSQAGVIIINPGDTLARIARTHSTTVPELKKLNRLNTDQIVAGRELRLPSGGAPGNLAALN